MIDGLKIRMTSEELSGRIAQRILWHQRTAGEYECELRRPEEERQDPLMPGHIIEHEFQEHREQAAVLTLLRDHLVPGETYLLSEMDLRFADLAPDFHMEYVAPSGPTRVVTEQ